MFWQVPPSFKPSHFHIFSWLRFKYIEYKGSLHHKEYSAEIITWNIKPFTDPCFHYFIQASSPPFDKLNSLHGVLRGHLPHKKWSHLFEAYSLPYDDFKISPQPIWSSKPHKYDNYHKATHKFPPTASFHRQTCSLGYSLPHN